MSSCVLKRHIRRGKPAPVQLQAVRVAGGRREVWRSPHSRCRPAEIARFLCELLLLDGEALARRYMRVG